MNPDFSLASVTLLDVTTGQRVTVTPSDPLFQEYVPAWEDGNWSCDCNRSEYFGEAISDALEDEVRKETQDFREHVCPCFGSRRFVVVDFVAVAGVTDLRHMNCCYPKELLASLGIK